MLDVAGVLRRARRLAGISQRELAARAGVSQSALARAETSGIVTVRVLSAVLEVAGLHLTVVDTAGGRIEPMRADGCRDRAGRLLPSHVDPWAPDPWWYRQDRSRPYDRVVPPFTYRREPTIDAQSDHPSNDATFAELRRRQRLLEWQERRRLEGTGATADGAADGAAGGAVGDYREECSCGPECERECVEACTCQCEPRGGFPPEDPDGLRDAG